MRRLLPLLAVLLLGAARAVAAVPEVAYRPALAAAAGQWQPIDLVFRAGPADRNPFDVPFAATFTGPDGDRRVVPGFHDGADRFVVRFSPPAPGRWTFLTTSTLAALGAKAGTLDVAPAPAGRRGPIGLRAGNPRQFVYSDGTPYFPIAFEIDWLFALDAEDATGIPKTETLLHEVAANGFNQVVMNIYAYDVQWPRDPKLDPRYDYGKPRVFPFGGTNAAPDYSTLSISFFQRFDRVVAALDRHGLAAHLMIYVWNKEVAWPAARSEADNRYFDYVVKRYQAFPNLIWDISKEATYYGRDDMPYITERIARLRALDGHRRLLSVHDYGYCSKHPEQVDFISIQNWQSETWHVMRDVRTRHPDKAIFNIEHGGYERGPFHVFTGNYHRPEVCLERAYQIVFAGAFPTHYWQDTSWNVVIHDLANLPGEDRPRLEFYRHLARLAETCGFTELKPGKGYANSGFCLSNEKDFFVFLVPKENDFIMVRPPAPRIGRMQATWFDPFTGAMQATPERAIKDHNAYQNPRPGSMAVLIVRTFPE